MMGKRLEMTEYSELGKPAGICSPHGFPVQGERMGGRGATSGTLRGFISFVPCP